MAIIASPGMPFLIGGIAVFLYFRIALRRSADGTIHTAHIPLLFADVANGFIFFIGATAQFALHIPISKVIEGFGDDAVAALFSAQFVISALAVYHHFNRKR